MADVDQEGVGKHDQRDMAIPTLVATRFIVTLVPVLWSLADPLQCAIDLQWLAP